MSPQQPQQTPVAFSDVAANFSEEEWKLLHKWQKELYKNVMKEIDQALISLGPLIAASVFSLRAKEKEDVCPADSLDWERQHSMNCSPSVMIASSDVIAGIHQEENQHMKHPPDTDRRESHDGLSTGYETLNPGILLRINKGDEAHTQDRLDPERGGDINDPILSCYPAMYPDILLRIKHEEVPYCSDQPGREEMETTNCPSTGTPIVTSAYSLRTKDEGELYAVDIQDTEGRDPISPPASFLTLSSDLFVRTEREPEGGCVDHPDAGGGESSSGPSPGFLALSADIFVRTDQEQEMGFVDHPGAGGGESSSSPCSGVRTMTKKWKYGNSVKCIENKPPNKVSSQTANVKVFQSTKRRTYSRSQLWSDNNKELGDKTFIQCKSNNSNASQSKLPHQFNKDEHFDEIYHLIGHQRENTGKRSYQCNECKKSFSKKYNLIMHKRAHTGEKPFQCDECEKKFCQKGQLISHARIHTGEKPYQCTKCGNAFSHKLCLRLHERTHTGEKPYQCTECRRSFSHKSNLSSHEKIHTGEKSYQCPLCRKSFSRKFNLTLHERVHMGEKLNRLLSGSKGNQMT